MTQEEYQAILSRSLDNFSDKTYENLMRETLDRVSQAYDKRDGSMIYNAIAALCFEIAMLYGTLDFVFDATYIDTAPREYLIKRAADRSLEPKPATNAIYFANIDRGAPCPEGTRFSSEDMNFVVIPFPEEEGIVLRKEITLPNEEVPTRERQLVKCETAGTVGNSYGGGDLVPIEYVVGLEKANLCATELYKPAVDEEDTEVFRARVKDAMRSIAFGGNVADYKQKVLEIEGVGQVKVFPIWDGPGTVKLVIAGDDPTAPAVTPELLADLQEMIDPLDDQDEPDDKGLGIAPIGHKVTVVNVDEAQIGVALEVTKKVGITSEEVETAVEPVLRDYFASLVQKWSDSDTVIIHPSVIAYKILDDEVCASMIDAVDSVTITANDNEYDPWENAPLLEKQVPVVGTITVE